MTTEEEISIEQTANEEFKNVGDEGLFPNHTDKDIWISGFKDGYQYNEDKYNALKNRLIDITGALEHLAVLTPVGNPKEEGISFCCGHLQEIINKY